MDEIDAVGRQRGAGLGGGHDEREQTLNQLLVEMDGFDIKDNVILIAATNRPDILDPALLRPGRFDRQIVVDRPDLKGRLGILKIHARGKPLADDVDLEVLARRTPGFTGADLANLVNEAALLSARHGKKKIDMVELEEAIDRVVAGPERKSRLISDEEKRVIAYHESGHALVGHVLPNTDPIHKISIIPRGQALGYTLALPDRGQVPRAPSRRCSTTSRCSWAAASPRRSPSATSPPARATTSSGPPRLAKQMVTRFGMSDKLGPQTFGEANHEVFLGRDFSANADYSPEIAYEIDKEICAAHRRGVREGAHDPDRAPRAARPDGRRAHRARDRRQGRARGAARRPWDEYLANEPPSDDDNDASAAAIVEEAPADADEPEVSPDPPMAPGTPPAFNA